MTVERREQHSNIMLLITRFKVKEKNSSGQQHDVYAKSQIKCTNL